MPVVIRSGYKQVTRQIETGIGHTTIMGRVMDRNNLNAWERKTLEFWRCTENGNINSLFVPKVKSQSLATFRWATYIKWQPMTVTQPVAGNRKTHVDGLDGHGQSWAALMWLTNSPKISSLVCVHRWHNFLFISLYRVHHVLFSKVLGTLVMPIQSLGFNYSMILPNPIKWWSKSNWNQMPCISLGIVLVYKE